MARPVSPSYPNRDGENGDGGAGTSGPLPGTPGKVPSEGVPRISGTGEKRESDVRPALHFDGLFGLPPDEREFRAWCAGANTLGRTSCIQREGVGEALSPSTFTRRLTTGYPGQYLQLVRNVSSRVGPTRPSVLDNVGGLRSPSPSISPFTRAQSHEGPLSPSMGGPSPWAILPRPCARVLLLLFLLVSPGHSPAPIQPHGRVARDKVNVTCAYMCGLFS